MNFEKDRIALCIPVRGLLHETKGIWGIFAHTFPGSVYVTDALEEEEVERFLRSLFGRRLKYIPSRGKSMIEALNLLLQEVEEDIVLYSHNDVYLYGNWLSLVRVGFEERKIGFVCAFGSRGTLPGGGRIDTMSNMIEAELHGRRSFEMEYVTHGDGFFLGFRRKALEEVGGFDEKTYVRFHGYDRDICLSLLEKGWLGRYIPIICHHRSGLTSCSPEYQEYVNRLRGVKRGGDKMDHDENLFVSFNRKWGNKLPVMVDGKTGEFIEAGEWGCKKWR